MRIAGASGSRPKRIDAAAPAAIALWSAASAERILGAGWVPGVAFAALAALFGLAYLASGVEATVTVDGVPSRCVTRAGTVRELLNEQGIVVRAGDLVAPGLPSRLADGAHVRVQRARTVRIRVDGETVTLNSHASTIQAILDEAGVEILAGDQVEVDGEYWPLDRPGFERASPRPAAERRLASAGGVPLVGRGDEGRPTTGSPSDGSVSIDVYRAVPVTLVESGIAFALQAAGPTVGEALATAGVSALPEDILHPSPDSRLVGGMRIDLFRATSFAMVVKGERTELRAYAATVGEALERAGHPLLGRDYAIPAADTPLVAGLAVEVVRVIEDVQVNEVPIAFATEKQPDPERALDETEVLRPGVPGLKRQRVLITYENGEELSREVTEEEVIREPVSEILAYGTRIVWHTIDTPEGPKRYWRTLRVYATSYSPARSGTPSGVPWYGRTWMGLAARKGIIATDARVIPMGTWVYVPGYGVAVAGDKGGGIRRYHIDLCFDDDNYESWHQYVEIYLLEPLPPDFDMVWILP